MNAHPTVTAYVQRHRLEPGALRADGRLTLRVDGQYRVQVRPAADGRIALSARLLDLGGRPQADTERLLQQLATLASGMLQQHAAALAVDAAEPALVLQQLLPADTGVDAFEDELADYVNALAFWQRTCAPYRQ